MTEEQYLPFESSRITQQKLTGNIKVFDGPTTKELREELSLEPSKEALIERLSELKKELETLRSFGINVVNLDIIVGKYPNSPDNTGFVFTDFIEGLSLNKIHNKPDDLFDEKLIRLCENFSRYYKSKSENKDGIMFTDFHNGQFVYGKNKDDNKNNFWFVDVGTNGFLSFLYNNQIYLRSVIVDIFKQIKQILKNHGLTPSNEIVNNFKETFENFGGTEKMFNAKI